MMTAACDHDWRVNPNLVLTSNPPRQQLVCVLCGEKSSRSTPGYVPLRNTNPRDWPKAGNP